MSDPDLSGVHPLRLAETRKRLAAVEDFLRLDRPNRQTRVRYAAELGLTERYFTTIAAKWRDARHRGDVSVLGATTGGKQGRKPGRGSLAQEARRAVADAIATLGSNAPLKALCSQAAALCAERGVKPPSRSTVWNLQMAARSEGGRAALPEGVATGSIFVRLPVEVHGHLTLPEVLVRASAPGGLILSHRVMIAVRDEEHDQTFPRPPDASETRSRDREIQSRGQGRILANLLGRDVGGLEIVYNELLARPAARLIRSRHDAPISRDEALHLIFEAVARHNERRLSLPDNDQAR